MTVTPPSWSFSPSKQVFWHSFWRLRLARGQLMLVLALQARSVGWLPRGRRWHWILPGSTWLGGLMWGMLWLASHGSSSSTSMLAKIYPVMWSVNASVTTILGVAMTLLFSRSLQGEVQLPVWILRSESWLIATITTNLLSLLAPMFAVVVPHAWRSLWEAGSMAWIPVGWGLIFRCTGTLLEARLPIPVPRWNCCSVMS